MAFSIEASSTKRYREAAMVLQVGIFDSGRVAALGNLRDVERFVAVFARPGYFAASEAELLDALADELVVAVVDDAVAGFQQDELLEAFLLYGLEPLLVSLADVGDETQCGFDNLLEVYHFVGLGDTGLEDSHLGLGTDLPYREGNTDLRVVAAGRAHGIVVGLEQLVEPLLDRGLAVTARDAYHRYLEAAAVCGSQLLQGRRACPLRR